MQRLLLIALALFPSMALGQTLRSDLQTVLAPLLCEDSQAIPDTFRLWQHKVFETQMDAAWIRSADGQRPLLPEDLASLAQEQAQLKHHGGFAYGLCSAGLAWIVTTPASEILSQWTPQGLELTVGAMREHCREVALHFAKNVGGPAKQLKRIPSSSTTTLVLHPELLEAGTLGLTCYPANKALGPELWSLIPIHEGTSARVPLFAEGHAEGASGLIEWIQAVRASQGLKPLKTGISLLRNLANQLAKDNSIHHPHARLLEQKRLLAKKNIRILGENRVKATNNQQMAWLLWYSPTHRQLLLHKSATALGLELARLQNEKLLVLVLAKI